jgi:hypothetical protein
MGFSLERAFQPTRPGRLLLISLTHSQSRARQSKRSVIPYYCSGSVIASFGTLRDSTLTHPVSCFLA